MRLNSAVRTATACAIVGGATIYGPKPLVSEIKFAAFSYLTAVIIVSDASLGDTLRGCLACILCDGAGGPTCHASPVDHGSLGGLQLLGGSGGGSGGVSCCAAGVHPFDGEEDCFWPDCAGV
ncbi:UNVERIFIED_CONTAM: hypothetical protein Sangu_2583900 [Sesamum angustifolium]|uniref:Uncharacterized protein n=1 Tax=Sesamum angustifolium TaxID=2727405 RepID=A0AAW2J6M5_9LAMI